MNRRLPLLLLRLLCVLCAFAVQLSFAQDDGLNLPTELYVLENDGVVTRYGIGTAGITDVTPSDAFVLDFAVAPDDNHIAYRTEQGLTLKAMFSDESLTIEAESASLPPIRGRGDTIAWSNDVSMLAYTTLVGARVYFLQSQSFADISQANVVSILWSPDDSYLAVEAQSIDPAALSNFWWIYRRDGTAFTLVSAIPSSIGVSWQDNARIVFAPETGGLYVMDLSAANAQTELLDTSAHYRLPFVRSDGTITAFTDAPAAQNDAVPTSESTTEATAVPPSSTAIMGRLIALVDGALVETGGTPIDVDRLRWAPQGDLLIAFRGGALAIVSPASGLAFSLPMTNAVAYGWGPIPPRSVSGVELPTSGYFLSDIATGGIAQLWLLPSDGTPAYPFTLVEDPITEFAVSPDGGQVVYVSGGALWLQSTTPEAVPSQLVTLETADAPVMPTFSPNADQIAFADGGIWLVSTDGGDLTEMLDGAYTHPQFASNVNALLVTEVGTGIGVLDLAAGAFTAVAPTDEGFWLRDGRIAAVSDANISIYDLTTLPTPAQVITLPQDAAVIALQQLANDTNLQLMLTQGILANSSLNEVQIDGGTIAPITDTGYLVNPTLSPDGTFIAAYRYQRTDANGIVRGPLLFIDINSGERVVLNMPSEAWSFVWE